MFSRTISTQSDCRLRCLKVSSSSYALLTGSAQLQLLMVRVTSFCFSTFFCPLGCLGSSFDSRVFQIRDGIKTFQLRSLLVDF